MIKSKKQKSVQALQRWKKKSVGQAHRRVSMAGLKDNFISTNMKTRKNAERGGISHIRRRTVNGGTSCARKLKDKFWIHMVWRKGREDFWNGRGEEPQWLIKKKLLQAHKRRR